MSEDSGGERLDGLSQKYQHSQRRGVRSTQKANYEPVHPLSSGINPRLQKMHFKNVVPPIGLAPQQGP